MTEHPPRAYRNRVERFRWWLIWRLIGGDGIVANVTIDASQGVVLDGQTSRRVAIKNTNMFGFGAAVTVSSFTIKP